MQIKDREGNWQDMGKLDGVPFFDIPDQYELLTVYYAVFSSAIVITQIAKVLNEKHLKRCGSKYVMFQIFGNPEIKFTLHKYHGKGEGDSLENLRSHTQKKMKVMRDLTKGMGKHFTEPQYLNFKPNEARDKKTKRFVDALTDLGLGDVEQEEVYARD